MKSEYKCLYNKHVICKAEEKDCKTGCPFSGNIGVFQGERYKDGKRIKT